MGGVSSGGLDRHSHFRSKPREKCWFLYVYLFLLIITDSSHIDLTLSIFVLVTVHRGYGAQALWAPGIIVL